MADKSCAPAIGLEVQPPVTDPAAVAALLKELFPQLFAGLPKPIKLRIQLDIEQLAPGRFTKQALSAYLRRYTSSTAYLNSLLRSPQRFGLDGLPAGEVSAEHKAVAQTALSERRKKIKAREEEVKAAYRWRAELLRDWEQTSLSRPNFCALRAVPEAALEALLEQAKSERLLSSIPPLRKGKPLGKPDERAGKVRRDKR